MGSLEAVDTAGDIDVEGGIVVDTVVVDMAVADRVVVVVVVDTVAVDMMDSF